MAELLFEFVNRFLNQYSIVKNEAFGGHVFGNFIRQTVPDNVYKTNLIDKDKYLVTGSVGQGNWAMVPWLCVFDKSITTTATKGVYVVYLLSKDGNSLYLTLNQGCTDLKKNHGKKIAIKLMRENAKKIAAQIDSKGFRIDEDINLGDGLTELGEMYQKGTIFYKEYKKGDVPGENVLRDDLEKMMEIYEEYAEKELAGVGDEVAVMEKTNEFDLNIILYGPPGTGKTYNTAIYAVAICDGMSLEAVREMPYEDVLERYNALKKDEKRVSFTTFHQSYGYEEFIEGIKPKMDSDASAVEYTIKDGAFKEFCDRASKKKAISGKMKVREDAVIWNVILGGTENPDLKQKCFDEGTIRIGWYESPEIITYDTEKLNDTERRILLNFQDEMEIGDIVVARSTASAVNGIGIVAGEAEFDTSNEKYPRKRRVDWLCSREDIQIIDLNGGTRLDRKSVYPLSRISVGDLLSRVPSNAGVEVEDETRPYVFIIDEINRGNISKIFGELITLIEPTKRKGAGEAIEAILPYSNKSFSVPKNVYIIGTMNTADRSIALMDTALRRRFQFEEMMPDAQILRDIGADIIVSDAGVELNVADMLEKINQRIEYLYDREHTIGHAFFTGLKDEPTVDKLAGIFKKSVIPLLQEYFYEDYSKIMLVLGDNDKDNPDHRFIQATETKVNSIFKGDTSDIDLPDYSYKIQEKAFSNIMSYIGIID